MTGTVLTEGRDTSMRAAVVLGPAATRSEVLDALCQEGLDVSVVDSVDAPSEIYIDRSTSLVVLISDRPIRARSSIMASVREHSSHAHVVLVCTAIEGWEVRGALAAGAAGIVLRAEVHTALGPCITAVQAGQICVPHRNRGQIERPVLSSREKQILGLVVMGYMNGQIGERLFLAESTVKSHLSSAFSKLEVHSRHEAVDLILNPDRGLALGILALGGEPLEHACSATP